MKELTDHPGNLALKGSLRVALKTIGFAAHRFDSCSDPLAKVCCMLLAIALLLSFISTDKRLKKAQRELAADLLKKMQPKFLAAAGVS